MPACTRLLPFAGSFALLVAACGGAQGSGSDGGDTSSSGGSSGAASSSGGSGGAGSGSSNSSSGASSNGGSSGAGSTSGGSSGARDAASPPADAATCGIAEVPMTCNAINPTGPMVHPTCVSSEPPQPQGGTLEDGTYLLQAFTYYGSCPTAGADFLSMWVACNGRWDLGQNTASLDGGPTTPLRANYTTTVQGTTIAFTTTCDATPGTTSMMSRGYTATPGHLRFIFEGTPGTVSVGEYAKQ